MDGHDVFKNQWAKRRRYYKKCEYTIRSINSVKYGGFGEEEMDKWKLVYTSASSAAKSNSCKKANSIVKLEDSDKEPDSESQGTDDDAQGTDDEDTKKHKGPMKCMVVLED